MCPRFPTVLPLPLISLRLNSDNHLDSVLTDTRGAPLFALQTEGNITTLSRCDPAHGASQLSASVEWPLAQPPSPKAKEPVANVFIDGRTEPSDSLFKKSIMGNSRKFQLPNTTGTFRWKRVGDHYQCSLCSLACTCHTAVATLQPSTPTKPGELSVFSAALNADPRQSQYSSVSVRLLEYLIITSVLLTTAHDDWRRFPNAPDFSSPPLSSRSLRQRLSPPSSPISTNFNLASPTRPKLDLLEGDSDPFYSSSPTSTHYITRTLSRSRSSNYLRPTIHHSTPFSTPPSTPPIAYHELPADTARHPVPIVQHPSTPTSMSTSMSTPTPAYSAHHAPPVPPIPPHFLAPPKEAPPSYAEIEWTIKVPQHRVSRREREQGSLLA